MKYLSNYTEEAQTKLLKKFGAFFAFSNQQFNEQKKADVVYCQLGAGLIAPKMNVQKIIDGLENIRQEGIKQDIAENGIEAIIERELFNHECFYTGSIEDAVEALTDYGINRDEIIKVYRRVRPTVEY